LELVSFKDTGDKILVVQNFAQREMGKVNPRCGKFSTTDGKSGGRYAFLVHFQKPHYCGFGNYQNGHQCPFCNFATNCKFARHYMKLYRKLIALPNRQLVAVLQMPVNTAYRELGVVKTPTELEPVETPPLPEGKYHGRFALHSQSIQAIIEKFYETGCVLRFGGYMSFIDDIVIKVQMSNLKPHPLNAQVYGDSYDADLAESIKKHGILTPLLVTMDNVIISGHRRWNAARDLGLAEVPVITSDLTDEMDIEEAVLVSNKQRQKTNEQIAREFQELKKIEEEKAKKRQATSTGGSNPQLVVNLPQAEKGKSRDLAAEKLGVSGRTAEKAAKVVAKVDELRAEGKKKEAQELLSTLNEENVNKAYAKMKEQFSAWKKEADVRSSEPNVCPLDSPKHQLIGALTSTRDKTNPQKTQPDYSKFATPPRTEEEKERDKTHNERVVSRMVRLAGIVKYMERVPEELITFIYRDMAKLYHPDKQHGEKPEVAQKRAEAFALIADIRQILEVSDAEYRELAKSKGIIETQS
jgi:ParB/RepB/Spo0J family partition protein